jgi:hypothetical protein
VTDVQAVDLPSGSYTVSPDGTFTLTVTVNGSGTYAGQVLAGGSNFVLAQQTPNEDPGVAVGIQRIDSGYTDASLDGDYSCVGLYADSAAAQGLAPTVGNPLPALQGFSSNQCTVTFDGLGNYSGNTTESRNGVLFTPTISGTYSVTGDGTASFTPTGETVAESEGQLLAGGSSLITSAAPGGNDPEIELFVQQQPGAYSTASLNGKYTVVDYGYDHTAAQGLMPNPGETLPPPNGFQGSVVIFEFDGSGNFTASGTVNSDGQISPISSGTTGTYTVDVDGTVKFTSGLKLSGQMLQNRSMFILGTSTLGEASRIAVGLIR